MSSFDPRSIENAGAGRAPEESSPSGLTVPNPMANAPPDDNGDASNKRTALAGQWRTPPTPFFPTGQNNSNNNSEGIAAVASSAAATGPIPQPAQLPSNTEDYAKALQEAYRRGAEAAALAAKAQQQQQQQQQQPSVIPPHAVVKSEPSPAPAMVVNSMIMPPPLPMVAASTSNADSVSGQPMQVQVIHHHHHHHPNTNSAVAPEAASAAAAAKPVNAASAAAAMQQRSVSLPDMASYAAQQEEEKRQKRLARNRASARLRRLRKKNLVDAYETEVGSLEKTIEQLGAHEWGSAGSAAAANHGALAEALSMDRGQQQMTNAERCQAANDILSQQLQFLGMLEDLLQEQYVLQQLAYARLNSCSSGGAAADELHQWKDLDATLQLTDDQCREIVQHAVGWEDEWTALQTVKSSLQAMKDNEFLWNQGCFDIANQFLSILHKNQISKFLLWADHNAETIEELDGVHAVQSVADSPVFQFGMDNNPSEALEEEKAVTH